MIQEKSQEGEEEAAPTIHIPSIRRATSAIRLAANIWVFILFANVEAEVINNVAGVFNDIGTLRQVSRGSVAANIFKLGQVIGMGSGRETRENVLPGEQESTGADGEECALAGWVLFLKLGPVIDQAEGFLLFVEDILGVAADDDENIKILEALVCFLERELAVDDDALLGQGLFLGAGNSHFEGFGGCFGVSANE